LKKTESGMTLLEVLLAATILGVGIVALLGALVQATRTLANVKETTIASSLARAKLEEILSGEELEEDVVEGEFEEPHDLYRWKSAVEPYEEDLVDEEEEDLEDLMKVRVEVLWDRGDRESVFYLETLKLKEMPELLAPVSVPSSRRARDVQKKRRSSQDSGQEQTLRQSETGGTQADSSAYNEQRAIDSFFGQK